MQAQRKRLRSSHLPLADDIFARTQRFQPQMKTLLTIKMTNVYDLKTTPTELLKNQSLSSDQQLYLSYLGVTQRLATTQITASGKRVETKSNTQSTKHLLEAIAD